MAKLSPTTPQEILSRRRGRKRHNAFAEVVAEAGPSQTSGASDAGNADVTVAGAPAPAAADSQSEPSQRAESSPPAPQPTVEFRPDPKTEEALRESERSRMELERRFQDQQARMAEIEAQAKRFESQVSEFEGLRSRFAETEAELASARRREFELGIDRRIEDHVSKLTEDSDISPEAARTLAKRVLAPMISEMTEQFRANEKTLGESMQTRISDMETKFSKDLGAVQQLAFDAERRRVNSELLSKYPDIEKMTRTKTFGEFSSKTPRFSLDNYGTLLEKAYAANNLPRIMDIMAEFAASNASRDDQLQQTVDIEIASTAASQPATVKQEYEYTYEDIGDARRKMQSGEMTREQFRAFKAKFDKAERDGRVQG